MQLGDDEKDYYLLGAAGIAPTWNPMAPAVAAPTGPADPGGQSAGEAASVGNETPASRPPEGAAPSSEGEER
jgi:hypothetical protein